jgi:pilus assembly protein CpaE
MPNRETSATPVSRRVVVISPNAHMVAELEPILQAHLADAPTNFFKGYPSPRDLAGALTSTAAHLVFLDTVSDREQAVTLLAELARVGPNVQLVALLSLNDPDLILRCLRAGASDFLVQPFTADQLEGALAKLARIQPSLEAGREPAKVIAVMPAKGACGATTIACNLAFYWKRMGAKKILLADMDPLAGTVSFLLKIKSIFSFLDALQRSHELDKDLWQAMITPVNGVDVLLAPEMMPDGPQEPKDPSPILDFARHFYDVIILDTGSVYGEWNLVQARQANELLVVTTNELPALQAAQRALSYLDANRIGRWKVRLLVNRYHRDVGLNRDVIGTALHTEVFESVPSDYESVQRSLMDGKPVPVASPFGKSLSQITERLSGRAESTKKASGLSGLMGLFSRTTK